MSEEQVLVTGVPVKSSLKSLIHWLNILLGMNIIFVLYLILTTEADGYILAYILWGIWLPCFGRISIDAAELRSLEFFSVSQLFVSVLTTCCALSVGSFYWTFQGMCKDCYNQFVNQDGTCFVDMQNTTLTIESDDCLSMPPANTFYATAAYSLLIGFVGLMTAFRGRSLIEQKKVRVIVLEDVPSYLEV